MNQGLLKRYKEQLEKLKLYLNENQENLTQEQIDALLDRMGSLIEMIQLFEST